MNTSTTSKPSEKLDTDAQFALTYANFNTDEIEVDETINAVFVVDTSSSVGGYVNELNAGLNEFVQEMQKSHVADQLFCSFVTFSGRNDINVKSGFQPIKQIPTLDFTSDIGGITALYDATKVGLQNAIDYRNNLENSGVNAKTLLFIITDGGDNDSTSSPNDVQAQIKDLLAEERNIFTFTSILFGIGKNDGMEQVFTDAQQNMGIEHLANMGNTGKDIRNMIQFISASISSVSAGQGISTPNF